MYCTFGMRIFLSCHEVTCESPSPPSSSSSPLSSSSPSSSSLFSSTTCNRDIPENQFAQHSPRVLPFRLLAAGDVPRVSLRLLPFSSRRAPRAPFLPPRTTSPFSRTLPVEHTFFCFLSREILNGHEDDNVGLASQLCEKGRFHMKKKGLGNWWLIFYMRHGNHGIEHAALNRL